MLASPPPVDQRAFWIAAVLALGLTITGMSLYVDQLLVTFLHESSHGLAAILTGGRLVQFTISADTSGLALTVGGFRPLVLVAGYLGGCAWGGAMLVAARAEGAPAGPFGLRFPGARTVLLALAAFMGVFTLFYVRSLVGLLAGFGWAAFFGWAALKGRGWQLSFLLSFLAVRNSINALVDLRDLVVISSHYSAVTDAQLMSRELTLGLVPPVVFALGIAFMSVVVFAAFAYLAFRPRAVIPREPAGIARV